MAFGIGLMLGWITPAIPKLTSSNTPLLSGPLTSEDLSWVVSIACIGSVVGAIGCGITVYLVDCKRTLLLLAIPSIAFWLLIHFGTNFHYIFWAKFFEGYCSAGQFSISNLFVSEIANDK